MTRLQTCGVIRFNLYLNSQDAEFKHPSLIYNYWINLVEQYGIIKRINDVEYKGFCGAEFNE